MHKIYTDVDKGLCVENIQNANYDNTFPMAEAGTSIAMSILVLRGYKLDGIVIQGKKTGTYYPMSINSENSNITMYYRQILIVTFTMPDEEILITLRSNILQHKQINLSIPNITPELKHGDHLIYWNKTEHGVIRIFDNGPDDSSDATTIEQHVMNVVPVTIIPENGYHVNDDSIKVTCIKTKEEISIDHLSHYAMGVRYTAFDFVMPDDHVVVSAFFEKDEERRDEHRLYANIGRIDGTVTLNSYYISDGGSSVMKTGDKGYIKIAYEGNLYPQVFMMGKKTLSKIELSLLESYTRDNHNRFVCKYYFSMPDEDVILHVKMEGNEVVEEVKNIEQAEEIKPSKYPEGVIDYFDIPEELAKELSDLLTKQVVRERLLLQVVSDPVRYEEMEMKILPITAKIEAIKVKITDEYVPEKYRSTKYMWNYSGYEVDKNKVQILEQK